MLIILMLVLILFQDCIDTEIKDTNGKKAIDLAKARFFSNIVDYI